MINVLIGIAIGIVAVFVIAYAIDAYVRWRPAFRQFRERRWERPRVACEIVRMEITKHSQFWEVHAYDRANARVRWDIGDHPMDAIATLAKRSIRGEAQHEQEHTDPRHGAHVSVEGR